MFALDYYDIAYDSCSVDSALEKRLGYKKIFIANKDIKVIEDTKGNVEDNIIVNSNRLNALAVLSQSPNAVILSDLRIDKKLMEQMLEKEIAICLPMYMITGNSGMNRSKTLYMMSKLLDYAMSLELDVSFITLAKSSSNLCSYMQLIELAKLLGADEQYARKSVSEINSSLVIE